VCVPQLFLVYVPAPPDAPHVRTAEDAANIARRALAHEAVEVFIVLCLNTRAGVIGCHEVSRGTLDATLVHPREVFKVAMLANAASVVVAHNHPSGNERPSDADVALTARLRAAGDLLGITLLDHIIIGHGDRFFSSQQHGWPCMEGA
jgi:DNA repair protein RadC